MKTMEITKETAKKLYKDQPGWFQERLNDAFGEDTFKEIDYNQFESFEDLFRACGTTAAEFDKKWKKIAEALSHIKDVNVPKMKQDEEMSILVKAYNQDWVADPLDSNQKKWFPYFSVSASGLGFSDSHFIYDYTNTSVGSRFAFKDEARSTHAGKKFTKFFEKFNCNKFNP